MIDRLLATPRRLEGDLQILFDFVLPDVLAEEAGAEGELGLEIVFERLCVQDAVGHSEDCTGCRLSVVGCQTAALTTVNREPTTVAGSVTVITVPMPGRDETSMRPPCSCTMR